MGSKRGAIEVYPFDENEGDHGRMKFGELNAVDRKFFYHLFAQKIITSEDGTTSHINIPGGVFGDEGEQHVLIIRDAYERIIPHIEQRWGESITLVTGTPGIGKTYLGAWHLRLLIWNALANHKESIIAYFKKSRCYVFTWDANKKASLGLQQKVFNTSDGELFCGVSTTADTIDIVYDLLREAMGKCYMIADPQDGDSSLVDNQATKGNLVVYASHGHPVIKKFASKRPILDDNNTFVLPGWSEREQRKHLKLLRLPGGGEIPEKDVQERIFIAGKMVSFLVAPNIGGVRAIMDSKIDEVVQTKRWNNMEDIFSPTFKGSLVSLDVCGYEYSCSSKEQSDGNEAPKTEKGATGEMKAVSIASATEDKEQGIEKGAKGKLTVSTTSTMEEKERISPKHQSTKLASQFGAEGGNPFARDKAELTHVSDYVIRQLEAKLKTFTAEEIGSMAESWSTNGYMSVFGALFERNSHIELQEGCHLPLYAVLPDGGKSQRVGTLEVPAAKKISLLYGNDPTRLASLSLAEGGHVRPVNSNFPTFDSYLVAGASSLNFEGQQVDKESTCQNPGNKKKRSSKGPDNAPWKKMKYGEDALLALALQCTVSGASGVPPRPKHTVYHNIITKSKSAFKEANKQIVDLCTVFVVPPICAEQFVYQVPQTAKGENVAAKNMPKVQFVAALSTRYSQGFERMVKEREEAKERQRKEAAITDDPLSENS